MAVGDWEELYVVVTRCTFKFDDVWGEAHHAAQVVFWKELVIIDNESQSNPPQHFMERLDLEVAK